jgi:hypothetical protein
MRHVSSGLAEVDPEGGTVTWRCQSCGEPIDAGEGFLCLPYAERRRYQGELGAWKERHPRGTDGPDGWIDLSALLAMPEHAKWGAWHLRCDPEPDESFYFIAVERIRSPWDVLHWTGHLLGKQWIDETDWITVLRTVSQFRSSV